MQNIFKRYEEKYLISREQSAELREIISQHMEPDRFGEYRVQNLYYDTPDWDVIRASIEKPLYKEKMRLLCYGIPQKESKVFLELKKKYKGIVYKRRIAIPYEELSCRSVQDMVSAENSQVSRELDFYMKRMPISERAYIAYTRTAFAGAEGGNPAGSLRITFDADLRFRMENLDFFCPNDGNLILPQNKIVMEVKTLGGMPLWLAHALSENRIYPASFSKYGACYKGHSVKQQEDTAGRMAHQRCGASSGCGADAATTGLISFPATTKKEKLSA
jgi:hypothetical protein